jgi:hypothetical protein
MLPATKDRVPANTAESVNAGIRRRTEESVARVAAAGPAAIDRRLRELEEEWDVERYVETMAPTFTLLGMTLGLTVSRKWFVLPFAVQSFFLQHALQGWCPPVPALRRMGVRTQAEIDEERYALKALRGDFESVPTVHDAEDRGDITRLEGEGGMVVEPAGAKPDVGDAALQAVAAARG